MNKMNQNNNDFQPSEGEIFIAEYFKGEKIKFSQEVTINNLRDDSKSYRVADFYLPKYNLYVEFFGRWNNSKDDRIRYREKRGVFFKNRIPCVYLYPENLGIIDFSFPKRMTEELTRHSMKKELFRYRLINFFKERSGNIFFLSLSLLYLTLIGYQGEEEEGAFYVVGVIGLFQIYKLFLGYLKFFK